MEQKKRLELKTKSKSSESSAASEKITQFQEQVKINRLNFSPHQYWVTQGYGMERPYTGNLWYVVDVGHYECTVCNKILFTFDDKF